jgi:cytochrome c oxidase subunit 4
MSDPHAGSASLGSYFAVFAALLGLTAVTVAVAFVDLGALNTVVAMTIAVVKGLLVMLFFMHLRGSEKLVWLYAAAGFAWLAVLILLTMSDIVSRAWL